MPAVHVKGGTHAGWKPPFAGAVRPGDWKCPTCGANLKYLKRCPIDGTARPSSE